MNRVFLVMLAMGLWLSSAVLEAKPFKRVLVVSGGGINPGVALGMIAGVKTEGWHPDLIIATCGAGIATMVYNSDPTIVGSFEMLRSKAFFRALSQFVIQTPNGIDMIQKLEGAKDLTRYPDIFEQNLLYGPLDFPPLLKTKDFNRDPSKPKYIFLSSRALFGPDQVGRIRNPEPLFKLTYFTDPDTAEFLQDRKVSKMRAYPYSTLAQDTLTISHVDVVTAMRAGIADPYLLNPSIVDGHYHFTGAVDLYPIDLALSLGEEVVATYPAALFQDYEDNAFKAGYGYKQTTRALEAIQHRDVKWVDISGLDDVGFNPKRFVVVMESGIPTDFLDYQVAIGKQWKFGLERGAEAIRVAPGSTVDVRGHLRRPINPKLLNEFSCRNAYEWKTDNRDHCRSDKIPGCNRRRAAVCTPIR